LTFDSFLSPEEAGAIVRVAEAAEFRESAGSGGRDVDGSLVSVNSDYRTSHTAWCHDKCLEEEPIRQVRERVESLTGFPDSYHEFPQFLRYTEGQYYKVHNDFIEDQVEMVVGPRVLTLFLYLSDVDEGGETHFPRANVTVKARRGRAALWPSVLNHDPRSVDNRTNHVANPVVRGKKYSVNIWLHLHDFKGPYLQGCAS